MTVVSTPHRKSRNTVPSAEQSSATPVTPGLPFDPPRRRSSLAFSRIMGDSSAKDKEDIDSTATQMIRPNVGRKRTAEPHLFEGHVLQVQKSFQSARTTLQFDMHFASSPMGSIDSRLPPTTDEHSHGIQTLPNHGSKNTWRYSTIPPTFLAMDSDVREPLPHTSPSLPVVSLQQSPNDAVAKEPISSGFTSPVDTGDMNSDDEFELPPLPRSSPANESGNTHEYDDKLIASDDNSEDLFDLTRPMTGLRVANDIDLYTEEDMEDMEDLVDDSPIVNHLRRRSATQNGEIMSASHPSNHIYLSRSAQAAAESAKAKRGLLRKAMDHSDNKENYDPRLRLPVQQSSCPDPYAHHYTASTPCPDPLAHANENTSPNFSDEWNVIKAQHKVVGDQYLSHRHAVVSQNERAILAGRITAGGSPMPHPKRSANSVIGANRIQISRLATRAPDFSQRSCPAPLGSATHSKHHAHRPSEHFRPGWHYVNPTSDNRDRSRNNLYSFSTAAAKVTGESAAPDLQIRNSYRTDTLTPLARPPGRFRKTGISSKFQPSQSRRYSGPRGLLPRPLNRRIPLNQARNLNHVPYNKQVQSSPPLPSTYYRDVNPKKRVNQGIGLGIGFSGFDTTEDGSVLSTRPSFLSQHTEEVMQVDGSMRTSLFASNTPGNPRIVGEGMIELSPNVSLWRKGVHGDPYYRKKRRPSYWDDDLEEVKMSPAGRGGIASSPVVSKRSMVADVEEGYQQVYGPASEDTEIIDDDTYADNNSSLIPTTEVAMTDVTELEA